MDLSLTNVQPCNLLTHAQVSQLKLDDVQPGTNNDGQGNPDCLWTNFGGPPDNRWLVRLDLKQDASFFVDNSDPLVHVVQVDGFPAVQSYSSVQDPNTHCILVVDVAAGQNMYVLYGNSAKDYPGISHQVACQQADRVAEMAVGNLRRLHG